MPTNEILEYVKSHAKELPAARWKGTSASGKKIVISEHHAGVDWGRGPWVKFVFKEGTEERELQGYRTFNKGDRIKFGAKGKTKECDDDQIDYTAATDVMDQKLKVILKFTFEQDGKLFKYRFEGTTN